MELSQHIEALEQYRSKLGDRQTDFLIKLWTVQDECEPEISWEAPELSKMMHKIAKHKPVLSIDTPQMDLEWFKHTLDKIRAVIRENAKDKESSVFTVSLESLKASDIKDAVIEIDSCVRKVSQRLQTGKLADENGMLALAVVSTIRAFSRACARKISIPGILDYEFPETPVCPVCGSSAALATVRANVTADGGHRHLYCSQCETMWHYPRIKCSYCGSVDPDDLRYFFSEEDPAHQMHVCRDCETAMPTVQLAQLKGLFSPLVEEAVTIPLAYSVMRSQVVQDFLNRRDR